MILRINKHIFFFLFSILLCNFFISCTNDGPKAVKNNATDSIPKIGSSKRESIIPLIDSIIVLPTTSSTKYKGKNLTTDMAKQILYAYFKKSGCFIEDSLPEKLSEADHQKMCVRFDTIYMCNINNDEYTDAVISYLLMQPLSSGHCFTPHRALIVDTDNGYKIIMENFIPDMFVIDSVVVQNKLTRIFGYDYNCGGTDSILHRYKLTLK